MKKNRYFTLLLALWALPLAAVQKLPIELNFSNAVERANWQILTSPDTASTKWVIAQNPDYAYGDDYMIYTSNDGGKTRNYSPTYAPNYRSYRCLAYYPLDTIPMGDYVMEFRYRGIGSSSARMGVTLLTNEPTASSYIWYSSIYSSDESGKWWKTSSSTFHSDGTKNYYLCLIFDGNERNLPKFPEFGFAIDAIQIYPQDKEPYCAQKPLSLAVNRSGTDMLVSWLGNASEYQMEYFLNDTSLNTRHVVDNITTTSYSIHPEMIPEGVYTIRVRSICGRDTSAWTTLDYKLIYDISKHCMDYMNFNDPNVQPQYGSFGSPWSTNKVDDRGFLSSSSRHTIHSYPRDFDARTNYKLRTFPKGEPAAVRLGNWETSARGEDIIYTMDVTEDMSLLLLRYAIVMQLPGHDIKQQPRFTLEFLDINNNLIDSCGYVDFTPAPDFDVETAEGWHREVAGEGGTDVIWKDWSMIGLSMRDYIGQTVKVRITTKDCSEGAHYGYAYFTMACSSGQMQGLHCGVKPDHLTVEEGFNYRWYHKYDPAQTVLSTDRTYNLTNPQDTATYCVDLINKLKPECYFTLEASSLAFVPNANGSIKYVPSNCKSYVQLVDSSSIDGVYWDENGNMVVVKRTPGAEEFFWDLGLYGTSTEHSSKIPIPDAGDTLHVTLHAYMENRLCEDAKTFCLAIPAVGTARTIDTYYFCRGGSITHNGQVYTEEIDFSDTLVAWNGCDSISTVALRYFQVDTVTYIDTVCAGHSYEWNGMTLTEGGEYFAAVKSKIMDCDSVHNILYLHQQPYLDMSLQYQKQSVCVSGGAITVPFVVAAGDVTAYDLIFSDIAKQYGFTDRFLESVALNAGTITIPLTDSLQPGLFDASVVFHNVFCDSLSFPITFAVYYDPDSLITQRWNDFLSVRKTAYDYYGGFTDYQWYKNDEPLAGQTGSQLYVPEEGLDMGSAYSVELTRTRDGMRVRTCPYYPHMEPNTVTITVTPTVMSSQEPVPLHIRSSKAARANLYNQSGNHMATWSVREGENVVAMPNTQGLYLLYIITESGEETVRKIIVQ